MNAEGSRKTGRGISVGREELGTRQWEEDLGGKEMERRLRRQGQGGREKKGGS